MSDGRVIIFMSSESALHQEEAESNRYIYFEYFPKSYLSSTWNNGDQRREEDPHKGKTWTEEKKAVKEAIEGGT